MPTEMLRDDEVEGVLRRSPLVRVAFVSERPWVVAFGFTYVDGDLVGMAGPGHKVALAEADARVGFQVDTSLEDGIYAWESVHGHGSISFGPPEDEVLEASRRRHGVPPGWFIADRMAEMETGELLTYRIKPETMSGIRCGPDATPR
ncbi:MAG: hypothetical protein GY698_13225 [Actinomycetia bacterium]|nr:hypothetical protein [Actinomycetes bacterium]